MAGLLRPLLVQAQPGRSLVEAAFDRLQSNQTVKTLLNTGRTAHGGEPAQAAGGLPIEGIQLG